MLTGKEVQLAEETAIRAWKTVQTKGIKDLTIEGNQGFALRVGIRCEIAVSKYFGIAWHGFAYETRKDGDVPGYLEVRGTELRMGRLIVRHRDPSDRAYILVRADKHPFYELPGWLWGYMAKKEEWERAKGHRISSYFLVPNDRLYPVKMLEEGVIL